MRVDRSLFLVAAAILSATTTACNRNGVPEGQVVAKVNGEEITLAELNEEARARGLPISRDPRLRGALMKELVDRKLLVQEALRRKVDREPAYLLAKRRSEEILLAQQLLGDALTARNVSDEQLAKVIAANPQAFNERSASVIDRLVVDGSMPEPLRRQLLQAPSVEAMQQQLKLAGFEASRGQVTLDSAETSDSASTAILKLKAGEPFAVPVPGGVVAGKVIEVTAQPVPAEQQLAVAREWLRRRQAQAAVDRLLKQSRPSASIIYQPGFGPDAASLD